MEPDLLGYATAFKNTFLNSYETLIEPEHHSRLGYLELLKEGRFIGYRSSTYGAGYEWRMRSGPWEVREGPQAINRLFAPFHAGMPSKRHGLTVAAAITMYHCQIDKGATLALGDGGSAFLWRSRLDGNSVIHLRGSDAELVLSESIIGSGVGRRYVDLAHLRGTNAAALWGPTAGAAAAENALLRARVEILLDRAARQPYQHLAKNSVLLLGDFSTEGRERLRHIEEVIARLGWNPVYVDQFDDIPHQDIRTKALTLASICRFVLMDDSSKAGQLSEIPLIEQAKTPAAILRLEGTHSSSMTRGIGGPYSAISTYEYNATTLAGVVETAAREAEERVQAIEKYLNQEYRAWRGAPPKIDGPKYGLAPMVWQSYE